ncbi:hypothetical protein Q1695_012124 [Nippostrongylus brasiliensis]|nr:hypothetical protein Q1695_012124 [Nippostrongylus brasiliensis]
MNHVTPWIIDDDKHSQLVSSLFDRRASHSHEFVDDRPESEQTLNAAKEVGSSSMFLQRTVPSEASTLPRIDED